MVKGGRNRARLARPAPAISRRGPATTGSSDPPHGGHLGGRNPRCWHDTAGELPCQSVLGLFEDVHHNTTSSLQPVGAPVTVSFFSESGPAIILASASPR